MWYLSSIIRQYLFIYQYGDEIPCVGKLILRILHVYLCFNIGLATVLYHSFWTIHSNCCITWVSMALQLLSSGISTSGIPTLVFVAKFSGKNAQDGRP